MAFDRLLQTIRENADQLIDIFVLAVRDGVPRYSLLPGPDLRESLRGMLLGFAATLTAGDRSEVHRRFMEAAERRAAQGFSTSDYLKASFVVSSTLQIELRRLAANDPALMREIDAASPILVDLTSVAASTFVDRLSRQLHAKNAELHRLNQQLAAHQRAIQLEVNEAQRQLAAADEFNHRVIQSLSSGLFATDRATGKITMFSSRLTEITGIQAEEALGREVAEAFGSVKGIDPQALIEQVKQSGSIPLTKMYITTRDGANKAVYVRAQTMLDEAGDAAGTVVLVDDVSEREFILDSFSRYVSKDLVRRLLARAEPLGLEGERRSCTILFADVRGFTSLAEGQDPEAVHRLLNVYFRLMIDSILGAGGFIDKFVGDKVMALFTDGDAAHHASAALVAAVAIKKGLLALNKEREAQGLPSMEIGIGVNTGEVLLGNIGSDLRMEFTAIGYPVNIADRLQHLARVGEILVGEPTAVLAGRTAEMRDRGDLAVRGRKGTIRVFELFMPTPDGEPPTSP